MRCSAMATPSPPPPRDQAPKADIDWFAGIEEPRAAGGAGAGAASGAGVFDAAPPIVSAPDPEDFPDLVGDAEGSPDTEWVFQEEPAASAAPDASNPDAEGPIVDAAIFGAAGDPPPQPLSRRELNARPHADRRRRVLTLVLVVALTAVVGFGIAAVLAGGSNTSAAKSEVKVIGTELPTTTPSTRPATTAAPATAAPTTPPATAAPAPAANNTTNRNTTPVRTSPPASDPSPEDPAPPTDPPPTDPPPTDPPPTDPTTTTTTTTTTTSPPVCIPDDPPGTVCTTQARARKWGITCSPHCRIVSRQASCGTVPIWMRHMISSAPASRAARRTRSRRGSRRRRGRR